MKELSLHILDIVENSIKARASLIELIIDEDLAKDVLSIEVKDNGVGMSEEVLEKVINPFYTTRTTRKVGLGIPLLKENAERCGGFLKIISQEGRGTQLIAEFQHSNIDRPPLGNLADTIVAIINNELMQEFILERIYNGASYSLDTREIKQVLEVDSLAESDILLWIKDYINTNEKELLI